MKTVNKKVRRKPAIAKNKKNYREEISGLIIEARKYYDQRQMEQANYLYQQVLTLEPKNLLALNGLGIIAMDTRMLSLAVELFETACAIDPNHLTVNKNLALVYTRLAHYDFAIQQYIKIINIHDDNGEVHGELARLYLQTGDLDLAKKHYKLAFNLNPFDPRNLHGLVQMDAKSITPEMINMVEKLLRSPNLSLNDRSSFYFALGAIYDAKERYDEAFANYSVANISKAAKFDYKRHEEYITNIIHTFTPELFDKYATAKSNHSSQPVFIVGMPRSGTTLVEQIMASHTDIHAAGELNLIGQIAQKLNLTIEQSHSHHLCLEDSTVESLQRFSQYYINDINNLALNNGHKNPSKITDKMPTNFIYLGLIALLFPNARIIHCRRNPLDLSLSCYFQNFAGDHGYACDLNNIGLYYKQYDRLMSHWKKVLPIEIHTVDYEEIIRKPEFTSKKLIKYIGIEWQDSCMKFYNTRRHVNTASLAQVRKKIYQTSVDRWCHYDKYLHYLKRTLNACDYADEATKIAIINSQNMYHREASCKYLH